MASSAFTFPPGATELSTVYVHGLASAPVANFDAGVIETLPITLAADNYVGTIVEDASGDTFVADAQHCTVTEFTPPATSVVVAGNGGPCSADGGDTGLATSATFRSIWGIAVNSRGDLFISEPSNALIRKVDGITGSISTIAGNAGSHTHTPDGVPAINATFGAIFGLVVDVKGNLFFSDGNEGLVRRIDASSGILTTVAGNFASGAGFSGDNGPATSAQLNFPSSLAIDSTGNLLIADANNNVIRRVDASTGIITTVAGQGPPSALGHSGDAGPATSALLNDPEAVAVDVPGNIYITDSNNDVIRKVNALTGIITTVAGSYNNGTETYTGDGGSATLAGLSYMEDVALDSAGNLYIADSDNGVIRKVNAASGIAAFASFPVGSSSPAINVTLSNDGNSTLNLSALAPSTNFNLSGGSTTCTSSSALTPGESCILGIEFLPTVTGLLNGTIMATDNVGNVATSVQSVALSGTGTAPVASQLALTGVAGAVAVGGNLGTVQVSVETSGGIVVAGSTAPITVTIIGPGSYSQQVTVDAVNGVASFDLSSLTFSTTGSYSVTATSSGLTQASVSFTVTAVLQAAKLALSTVPAAVAQGGNLGAVQVTVEASGGAVVTASSASITVTIAGPGSYSQQLTVSAVNGVASFDLSSLTFSTTGSYSITATSSGLTQASASFSVTAVVQAAKLALSTVPASVAQGGNLGTVQVSVESSGGTIVTASMASITVTITGPGSYSQQATVSAVNGVASFDLSGFAFAAVGNYTVTASSSGLTSAVATFIVGQNFTLSPPSSGMSTQIVLPGGAAVYQLQLAPAGATFSAPITLSATGLPPGATYAFNPPIVTPGASVAATVFTVNTVATAASLRSTPSFAWKFAAIFPAAFLLPWTGLRKRRRKTRWFRFLPLLLIGLSLGIAGLSGCSSGGLFGQPQTNYMITVTGTSGALVHTTTVTLTVQ